MTAGATYEAALWVIRRLREAGHEALLAGGCVRDMLRGETPSDYDVATDATPPQVKKLFRRVLMVGAQFGVAIVLRGKHSIEVATFRSDLSYSDGRRPDAVRFSSAQEDALRRDFTINGMFFDPVNEQVIDYVEGQADLAAGVIRAIGEPDRRFTEDYLRLVRAVRFAARLEFRLDAATADAIGRHAAGLTKVSGERILDELTKMLADPHALRAATLLGELRLAKPIFGADLAEPNAWAHGLERLRHVADRQDAPLAMAALLGPTDDKHIRLLTASWGASNELRGTLRWLAGYFDRADDVLPMRLCAFKRMMANPNWPRLLALWQAEELRISGADERSRAIEQRAAAIAPEQVCPAPLVTGEDLKTLGLSEGPELGRILRSLYDRQLDEELTTRDEAMDEARQRVRKSELEE